MVDWASRSGLKDASGGKQLELDQDLARFSPRCRGVSESGPRYGDVRVASQRLKQLIGIGIALTSERELSRLLELIVGEARR